MPATGGEAQLSDTGATRVAVVDHDRRHAGLGLPVGRHAAHVPSVADREQRQDADARVLGGVHGARHARGDETGRRQHVVADRVPERTRHQSGRRQVEILDAEHLAREEVLALEGHDLLGDLDGAEEQPGPPDRRRVVGRDDADVGVGARLRVFVGVARLDDGGPVVQVERADPVLLSLVQVQGAGMNEREGAVLVDGPDQAALDVDDAVVGRRPGAQAHARRRRARAGVEGAPASDPQPVVDH